jgi:hypothetical protein
MSLMEMVGKPWTAYGQLAMVVALLSAAVALISYLLPAGQEIKEVNLD